MRKFLAANFTHNAKRLATKAFLVLSIFALFTLTLTLTSSVHAQEIYTTGKLITVDIGKQKVFAWEGGKVVFETIASTGMRYTPTVTGTFKIQRKIPVADMKGNYPPYPPYHLKNVPNHMYFYGGYAIHGAYWHNKFGQRVSHGCVNVPVAASQWLFNWADVGTQVVVF